MTVNAILSCSDSKVFEPGSLMRFCERHWSKIVVCEKTGVENIVN
jgi:hypothetical protein